MTSRPPVPPPRGGMQESRQPAVAGASRAAGRSISRGAVLAAAGVAAVLVALAAGWLLLDRGDPPEILRFAGRLHPLIVHFPIALILLAALLELAAAVHRPFRPLRRATGFVLVLGSVGAVAAVVAGLLLSLEGGYDTSLLDTHMWLGIGVAAGAVTATVLRLRGQRRHRRSPWRAYPAVLCATALAVLLAGHRGSSLARGPEYLTHYMPAPLKNLVGSTAAHASRPRITDVDSAYVYQDLIVPVLQARCTSCHSERKVQGGLRLDSPEALMRGGDGGAVIVAGAPDESELLRRITLSPRDKKAMPPGGARPLDVGETELIRWWIAHGATLELRVGDAAEIPTAVATLLNRVAPPRPEKRPAVYALQAEPADPAAVAAVRRAGFGIAPVARDLDLLQVTAVNRRAEVGDAEIGVLQPVAAQVTWLDLAETRVGDDGLAVLAGMPNLTRLNLARTAVGDAGVGRLSGLEHLEYLNLFGSRVGDAGLDHLAGLARLKSLYLWQTRVTPEGAERLRQSRPDLRVILGTAPPDSLPPVAPPPRESTGSDE